MNHEDPPRPPGRPDTTQQQSGALSCAAFCMIAFAALVWPAGRMWSQTPRDWEMILPAFLLEAFLAVLAIVSIGRYFALRRRAGRPAKAAKKTNTKKKSTPIYATLQQERRDQVALPYPTLDPFDEDPIAAGVVVAAAQPEPDDDAFIYPDVPDQLGAAFQRIIETIRALPDKPAVLANLVRGYESAAARPRFRDAEEFVLAKAERHPAWDAHAYAEPLNPLNPALFLDQAEDIVPFAATIAAMVLIAEDLPEEVWDLLAAPWEGAGLEFPEVVLAG